MKKSFYLILPNIRSCHNVGAMFRTADACAVDEIFLVGYTPHPPRKEIDKVSLGAETWMPWKPYKNIVTLVKNLKKKGVRIVALEKTEGSEDIGQTHFDFPLALVVGNEVDGVDKKVLQLCDQVVHIPQYGKKESLNVSIAAGIAMYLINKQK